MANNPQNQQPNKPAQATQNAPEPAAAPSATPSEPTFEHQNQGKPAEFNPVGAAHALVDSLVEAIFANPPMCTSKNIGDMVSNFAGNVPEQHRVEFKKQLRLRTERLKQFSEMVFNEVQTQMANYK